MNRRIRWCSIVAALALGACGNKGPLVLPDKPVPAQAGQAAAVPAPDAAPAAATPAAPATPAPAAPPVDPDKPAEPLPLEDDE